MKALIYFITFFLILGLNSCNDPKPDNLHNPLYENIKFGRFVDASPFWKIYKPGTILIVSEDAIDVLHDNSWLENLNLNVKKESIDDSISRNCQDGECTLARSEKIIRGWTGYLNARLDEDNYIESKGTNLKEITKHVFANIRFEVSEMSALSAFNIFKNDPLHTSEYESFSNRIRYAKGERSGKLAVVSENSLVFLGKYILKFDKKLTAKLAAKISDVISIQLGGDEEETELGYIFRDNTFTINADLSTRPFLDGWKLDSIEI